MSLWVPRFSPRLREAGFGLKSNLRATSRFAPLAGRLWTNVVEKI
jgi:hypothetical protein